MNLSHSCYITVPVRVFDVFRHVRNLDLCDNNFLFCLPEEIGLMSQLETLNLTNCKNLISLPMSMTHLEYISSIELYGCINLRFPPQEVCVKIGLALTTGRMSVSFAPSSDRVEQLLDYMRDPRSLFVRKDRSKNDKKMSRFIDIIVGDSKNSNKETKEDPEASTAKDKREEKKDDEHTKAYGQKYVEYAIHVIVGYNHWVVRRRYSSILKYYEEVSKSKDFSSLIEKDPLPQMPPKTTLKAHAVDRAVVEERAKSFQRIFSHLCKDEFRKVQLSTSFKKFFEFTDANWTAWTKKWANSTQ